MKLKTNLFQGKKPSLEEGQMIYQIEADDIITNRVERNGHCRRCVQCMKIFFYIVLVLFILFVGWFGFLFLSEKMGYQRFRQEHMCATVPISEYDDLLRDQIQETFELDQKMMSDEEDLLARTWVDDTMGTETSTITDLSENHEFDVEMVSPAASPFDEIPSDLKSRIDQNRLITY